MTTGATKLKDLELVELSAVQRPANEASTFLLHKSKGGVAGILAQLRDKLTGSKEAQTLDDIAKQDPLCKLVGMFNDSWWSILCDTALSADDKQAMLLQSTNELAAALGSSPADTDGKSATETDQLEETDMTEAETKAANEKLTADLAAATARAEAAEAKAAETAEASAKEKAEGKSKELAALIPGVKSETVLACLRGEKGSDPAVALETLIKDIAEKSKIGKLFETQGGNEREEADVKSRYENMISGKMKEGKGMSRVNAMTALEKDPEFAKLYQQVNAR